MEKGETKRGIHSSRGFRVLTDGRNEKLKKWLDNTNWPEGFQFEHRIKMVKNYIADEVKISYGLDSMQVFFNANKLTRSEFDYAIQSIIKNIQLSSKTTLRYKGGKEALKK